MSKVVVVCRVDFESQESQLIAKHDEPVKCVEYCDQLSTHTTLLSFLLSYSVVPDHSSIITTEAVVSGSWDSTLKITPIDPTTRQPSPSLVLPLASKVYSLSLSRSKIVVAMGGRNVWIYDIPTIEEALKEGKEGQEVEVWSKRESNLKFMTRAIACMPDDTGKTAPPPPSLTFSLEGTAD